MTTQARSSFLPNEILWGHRFDNLVSFKKETGEHEVDYSLFNSTYEVDTPLCSAESLDHVLSGHESFGNYFYLYCLFYDSIINHLIVTRN